LLRSPYLIASAIPYSANVLDIKRPADLLHTVEITNVLRNEAALERKPVGAVWQLAAEVCDICSYLQLVMGLSQPIESAPDETIDRHHRRRHDNFCSKFLQDPMKQMP
jgi:hypothetical protein